MKSNENTMCELVRELKKKYQLESEENFIRIQINNRNYRICFYRIYKDRDGKIKKEKDKIQFWVENEAAIDNYLTTYQGVNEEKMIANMYKEIFYYNPLNSEMDSVDLILKSFEKFIKESSETRLCNHHKYVKNLVKICKNIFQEEQLNEDLKEKINAVLSVRISDIETEYCGCKQTRELMEIIRAKMIDREFIVSNWPEKVNKINEDLREQKKSEKEKEQYIRKCRSSVITKEFIDSFVQPDSANGYKGKDEGWNYYDDGFADDNIYYYANELDHYITHLVFGIVKTQTDMGKNIRFDKEEGMKKMDDFLKGKGICE